MPEHRRHRGDAADPRADGTRTPRVLMLTTFDLDEYVYEALRAGASGFLLKDAPAEQLVDGVRVVAAGDALLAPSVTRRLIEEFARRRARRREPPGRARRADRARARGASARRARPVERRDRRGARRERRDRQDPRRARADEARTARPRPGRRARLRDGDRHARRRTRRAGGGPDLARRAVPAGARRAAFELLELVAQRARQVDRRTSRGARAPGAARPRRAASSTRQQLLERGRRRCRARRCRGRSTAGTMPIGVSTASASPSQRRKIHSSTRLFSPNPGHRNLPSSLLRNQLT